MTESGFDLDADALRLDRTIAFVDLAGFTALTDAHGDDPAVELVTAFVALAHASLEVGVQLVKTLGDAVMLAASTPEGAIETIARIYRGCDDRDSFPELRAGVHHGSVVALGADFFGSTVNVAARVTSVAAGGQMVVTAPVVGAARAAGLDITSLGQQRLRHVVEPVELFSVQFRSSPADFEIDPVCRMKVRRQDAAGHVRHDGVERWFCSLRCTGAFVSDPDLYVADLDRRG